MNYSHDHIRYRNEWKIFNSNSIRFDLLFGSFNSNSIRLYVYSIRFDSIRTRNRDRNEWKYFNSKSIRPHEAYIRIDSIRPSFSKFQFEFDSTWLYLYSIRFGLFAQNFNSEPTRFGSVESIRMKLFDYSIRFRFLDHIQKK